MHRMAFVPVMHRMLFGDGTIVMMHWVRRLGVGRWAFLFFAHRNQFHPALGTFPRMILHHFRMHDAGVLLALSRRVLIGRRRRCLREQRRMDCRY